MLGDLSVVARWSEVGSWSKGVSDGRRDAEDKYLKLNSGRFSTRLFPWAITFIFGISFYWVVRLTGRGPSLLAIGLFSGMAILLGFFYYRQIINIEPLEKPVGIIAFVLLILTAILVLLSKL